jgi:hypothetical protein
MSAACKRRRSHATDNFRDATRPPRHGLHGCAVVAAGERVAACADIRCDRRADGYEAGPSRYALPLHFQAVPGLVGFQLGADPPVWTENLNCRNFVIPRRLT